MRRWITCAAMTAALGCGGDNAEDESAKKLLGAWVHELGGDFDCAVVFDFDDDGRFEQALVCLLESGDIGIETARGDYVAANGNVTLEVDESSCSSVSDREYDMDFEVIQDGLRLSSPDGILVLQRVGNAGGGGTANGIYGCFADDGSGAFEQRPISRL